MSQNQDPNAPESRSATREFLREWGFDLEAFEARAKQSLSSTRGDLGEVTGALRKVMASTKQTLIDLHKARQPVATELKSGFERAWDEIEQAFASARRRMRETREGEEVSAEKKPRDVSPDE